PPGHSYQRLAHNPFRPASQPDFFQEFRTLEVFPAIVPQARAPDQSGLSVRTRMSKAQRTPWALLGSGKREKRDSLSILVGADDFAIGDRAQGPPDGLRDRVLDALDRAVGKQRVAAGGVIAVGVDEDAQAGGAGIVAVAPQRVRGVGNDDRGD